MDQTGTHHLEEREGDKGGEEEGNLLGRVAHLLALPSHHEISCPRHRGVMDLIQEVQEVQEAQEVLELEMLTYLLRILTNC